MAGGGTVASAKETIAEKAEANTAGGAVGAVVAAGGEPVADRATLGGSATTVEGKRAPNKYLPPPVLRKRACDKIVHHSARRAPTVASGAKAVPAENTDQAQVGGADMEVGDAAAEEENLPLIQCPKTYKQTQTP